MAITYPLDVPTDTSVAQITLRAVDAVASTQSPFTYDSEVVQYSGQVWSASVQIPTVKRDLAEAWVAFLLSLDGPSGTFLLGDPVGELPRGSVLATSQESDWILFDGTWNDTASWYDTEVWLDSNIPPDVLVDGGSQTGETLDVKILPLSRNNVFRAGDYIQLGSGSTAKLYKILTDTNSDSNGKATLDIWPSLRSSPSNEAVVTVQDAKGVFRLSSGTQSWYINSSGIYNISFEAMEVIT